MDLIFGYPTAEIAWIGFFMTNIQRQNKGMGSKIVKEMCACLKSSGYQMVRLGADKGNPKSYAFWTKNQFKVIRTDEYILMERRLTADGSAAE